MKLKRINRGVWKSADGRWLFRRHESDPHPKRWFAHYEDEEDPRNSGQGHATLREAVEFAEQLNAAR